MEKAISATDANRQFSRILDGVRRGRTYVITSHGHPVARISPVSGEGEAVTAARKALFARLRKQEPIEIGHWTRDELYERER